MQHKLLINGELVSGEGEKQPVYNPATGKYYWRLPRHPQNRWMLLFARQMQHLLNGANHAKSACGMPAETGGCYRRKRSGFAELESRNCGKPLHSAFNDEIPAIVDVFRFSPERRAA